MAQNLYWINGDVRIMRFEDIYWADSDLEKIEIEYNQATILVWNDSMQKRFCIYCLGFAGITNLCIWDDTTIAKTSLNFAPDMNANFISQLFEAYDSEYDYGGRKLKDGLMELTIELTNHIPFIIYCQKIDVREYGTSDDFDS